MGFLNKENSNNNDFFARLNNHEFDLLYFVGSDNLEFNKRDEFIIYQGSHGDRIAQMVLSPVIKMKLEETNDLPKTIRGEGGFGSTGK